MTRREISVRVNGRPIRATVPANQLLIDYLREDLGLTGTKEGCGVGICGACSVLVDRRLMSACLLPVVLTDGGDIVTVEGLAPDDGSLSKLQDAFIRFGGFQCGICTPGQLIAATALLSERAHPTPDEVRAWMMGNLCRCTGYYQIVDAIRAAAGDGEPG